MAGPARLADAGLALLAGGSLAAAGAFVAPVAPGPASDAAPTVCWLRNATGVACPFCGMTRSFASCVRGHVAEGWLHHPMGPALVLGAVAILVATAVLAIGRRAPLWGRAGFSRSLVLAASLCLVTGVARTALRRTGG